MSNVRNQQTFMFSNIQSLDEKTVQWKPNFFPKSKIPLDNNFQKIIQFYIVQKVCKKIFIFFSISN